MNQEEKTNTTKPFLRWVGGKQRMAGSLGEHLPRSFNRYFEPFLGGGSLFFAGQFPQAVLSDLNPHLINAYKGVRDDPGEIHRLLEMHKGHLQTYGKAYYYDLRTRYNECLGDSGPEQAARFIFLIHSNFNGMHRVNKKGEYNVPFGLPKPSLPGLDHLNAVSAKLRSGDVSLCHHGYDTIIEQVGKGDLVYLDPPYPVLSRTANFTQYTVERFTSEEQVSLARYAHALSGRGAQVMVSIADLPVVRELYKGWQFHQTMVNRTISAKAPRIKVAELVIKNFTR